MVVLCGPAACGKSTFAQRHFRSTQIISSDWARALICDDERDQRFNAQAFALLHFLVEQRLTLNRLCVVDSTALTPQSRMDLLDLARKCQVPTTLILFDVPLETCTERDGRRERSVGKPVVERQYEAFQQAKAMVRQEGFDQVVEFQDDDLEKVRIEVLFRPKVRAVQRPQRQEAGASRRFDRSAQSDRRPPNGPRTEVHSASTTSIPAVTQPAVASRLGPTPVSVSTPKTATPQPAKPPSPLADTHPAPAVNATVSQDKASQ